MMDDTFFLGKARQVIPQAIPDEDIIEGKQIVLQSQPTATDDDIIGRLVEHAKAKKPELFQQMLSSGPSEQDIQSIYGAAEERARQKARGELGPNLLSGIGNILQRKDAGEPFRQSRERALAQELPRAAAQVGRAVQAPEQAAKKLSLISGVEQEQREEKSQVEESDPTSARSKTFQGIAKRMFPERDFEGMSASQLKATLPMFVKVYEAEANRQAKTIELEARRQERLMDREQKKSEKGEKKQEQYSKEVLGQVKEFKTDPVVKNIRDQLRQVKSINSLLGLKDYNTAFEVSKTMLIRLAGDPRPSDADLARINPHPSFIMAAKRILSKKVGDKPLPADVAELNKVTRSLEDSVRSELKSQALAFTNARSKFIKGMSPEDFEDTILTELQLGQPQGQGEPGFIRRKTKDGKIALFDEKTKEFVRYE